MIACVKRAALGLLMFVLYLQLSKVASIPISGSVAIAPPSLDVMSSIHSKLIELKSPSPDAPSEHDIEKRHVFRDRSKRWPNATVPYELDSDLNETQQQSIRTAMESFHNKTCVRFIEHSNQTDYLRITSGEENWSEVGRQGGDQQLTLSPGGFNKRRAVLHELMHTLGFLHEHNRPDRGQNVRIKWKNIIPGRKPEFKKSNASFVDLLNTTYDVSSIMHYNRKDYSKNTENTIETNSQNWGNLTKLSYNDVLRLRNYYDCECVDRHDKCGQWLINDHCTNRRDYMLMHCPKSCDMCHIHDNVWH